MAPLSKLIPFSKNETDFSSIFQVVNSVFRGELNEGEYLRKLEEKFADYVGVKYALTFSSGRFALMNLFNALGLRKKEIIIPAYTCIPVPNAVYWSNNTPVFSDINLEDYNISFSKARKLVTKRTGAVIPTHLHGLACDLKPFIELGKDKDIPVIEDAAIALGAEYNGKKVGSLGDAAMFSFQASKMITGWRGGIITTNNEELFRKLEKIRSDLKDYPKYKLLAYLSYFYLTQVMSSPPLYKSFYDYFLKTLESKKIIGNDKKGISLKNIPKESRWGFSNLQAGIAYDGSERIEQIIKGRRKAARFYSENLRELNGVALPNEPKGRKHVYGRYPIRLPAKDKFQFGRDMFSKGVEVSYNYPYICNGVFASSKPSLKNKNFPNAITAAREVILLPMWSRLKTGYLEFIFEKVKECLQD